MPVYVYRNLRTGETFEVTQRISEAALTEHPESGDPVKRLVQPVGIAFKGSGFYVNDSRSGSTSQVSKPKSDGDSKPESKSAGAAGSDAGASGGSTSEAKSTSKSEANSASSSDSGSSSASGKKSGGKSAD